MQPTAPGTDPAEHGVRSVTPPSPVPVRRRNYPGWRMVWALAVTETISHGILYYSFAAFLGPMQRALGYSQPALTGAFSLCVMLTGAAAVPVGAWLDRHGARALMTVGSLAAAGCVAGWAVVGSLSALYAAFAGIGLCSAAVLYEPAFVTINAYFATRRQEALLTLTMVGGLASTVALPACTALAAHVGWRATLGILAAIEASTAIPHVVLLRKRPSDHGWARDGYRAGSASIPVAEGQHPAPAVTGHRQIASVLLSRPVALLTAGAFLSSVASAAVAVHLLPYLETRGYAPMVAATATGALGIVQVLGRFVLAGSARKMPMAAATAVMLGAQVLGVATLFLIPGLVGVTLFVILFGGGFGVLSIARPDLLASYAPRNLYARLSGIQALFVVAGEAAGPTGGALLRAAAGEYVPVFIAVAALALAAAILFLAADRAHHRELASRRGPCRSPAR